MEIIYTDTRKPVAIGDVVKYKGEYYRVVDVIAHDGYRSIGRVRIKYVGKPFSAIKELKPHAIGAEWINYR